MDDGSQSPDVPGGSNRLGERLLDALDECARERPLGIRDLLRLDLCTGEAKAAVSGLHITLTREDTVPAVSIPVAQMTFAPELSMSTADYQSDPDRGLLLFEHSALRQNWRDLARV